MFDSQIHGNNKEVLKNGADRANMALEQENELKGMKVSSYLACQICVEVHKTEYFY